jgi:hypothetical protein
LKNEELLIGLLSPTCLLEPTLHNFKHHSFNRLPSFRSLDESYVKRLQYALSIID